MFPWQKRSPEQNPPSPDCGSGPVPGNVLLLWNQRGQRIAYEFLDLVSLDGSDYAVLMEVGDPSGEVTILRTEPLPGSSTQSSYTAVMDDATLQRVYEAFKERNQHRIQFTD